MKIGGLDQRIGWFCRGIIRLEVGVEKKIVAVELENCEMVEKREMAVAMLEFGANAPGFYGNYAQYLSFRCYVTFKSLSQ